MFGNNGKDNKKTDSPVSRSSSNSGPSSAGVNTIDAGSTIRGNMETNGDIRIDGKLIGDLVCKAKLIIGTKGAIEGDVDCQSAMIEGHFNGNLLVRDMLTMKETSNLDGSIRAKKMHTVAGAKITGQVFVTGEADPAKTPKPSANGKSNGNPLKQKEGATA